MEFTGERYLPDITDIQLEIEHKQRYLSIKDLVKGKRVLDAACGEGYGSFFLASFAESVTGMDIDQGVIEKAKSKYIRDNLSYAASSVELLPFESNSFDIVVSFETIEHVDEIIQHSFLEEVKRVLTPDGILIISTPNKEHYSEKYDYTNPFHVKEFTKDEFDRFLNRYFKFNRFYSQRFEVLSVINDQPASGENHSWDVVAGNHSIVQEQYMVAICSDNELTDLKYASVMLFPNKYEQSVDRIIELQNEVEERNQHIKKLDDEISFLRAEYDEKLSLEIEFKQYKEESQSLVTNLSTQLSEERLKIDETKQQVDTLHHENQSLQGLIEANKKKLIEKDIEIQNKVGHIEQLLVQERRLHNIMDSTGWRALVRIYKLRDKLLPANSKRKLFAKLTIKTLRHPKQMLSKLNKDNIKKTIYYTKTEDLSMLEQRIDNYMERHDQVEQSQELQLFQQQEFSNISFKVETDPTVSIIIPVYNQWDYTYACLASIKENTQDVSYEVIIADDMSTDETINIRNYVDNVTVVRDGENRGFLLNCNNAAKYARGKYLFFLNNDTNVQPEWLSSLVQLMERDESIGMTWSKLIYPDGRQQEAGGIIWNDASGWNYGRLDDPAKPEYNYVREVDYISGAAILIRSSIWNELGGFDVRYVPAYYEDTDLAFEVRRLGYKVMLQPRSVVVHFEGISHGTDTNSGIKSYQVTNKNNFLEKWKDVLTTEHFNNAENVFLARDRSKNKKTIVIVDHYVPHYDKDAGGRCTYFYTKLFASLGFKVVFIGDNFFQHEPYTSELQQLGVEVLYGNWYAKHVTQWIKNNGQHFDYVYLNRPHISIKYIDEFKKYSNAKIIYFGHDLHYIREMRNYEVTKNPSLLKSAEEWKKTEFDLFNKADVIHVVGSYEQTVLQEQFPNKLIRNIPLYLYTDRYPHVSTFEERKHLLFVGGFNHKPNHDGVKWFIDSIWPSIKQHIPDIKFYIVGSNPPDDILALQSESIIVTGYVSDEELETYYNKSRLVVVPLRFGAGVKGKVVEAMYYQIPIVTTSIGSEGLPSVEHAVKVADQEEEFVKATIQLYQDQEEWEQYSIHSGEYVSEHFTVDAAQKIISLDITN